MPKQNTKEILNKLKLKSKSYLSKSINLYRKKSEYLSKIFNTLSPAKQVSFFIAIILLSTFSGSFLGQKGSQVNQVNQNTNSSTDSDPNACNKRQWASAGLRCEGDKNCQRQTYGAMGNNLNSVARCMFDNY